MKVSLFVCALVALCSSSPTRAAECWDCVSSHHTALYHEGCGDPFNSVDIDKCTGTGVCSKYVAQTDHGEVITRGCSNSSEHNHGCFKKTGGDLECLCHDDFCNESSRVTSHSGVYVIVSIVAAFLSSLYLF